MARQLAYDMFREEDYTSGLNVYTTIVAADQRAANAAVHKAVVDYDRKHGYRGPESYIDLPAAAAQREQVIEDAVSQAGDVEDFLAAVVVQADAKSVTVSRGRQTSFAITGEGLKFVSRWLNPKAAADRQLRPGALVRIADGPQGWEIVQTPEVESSFVSIRSDDGAVRAMVGGYDYSRSKFNRVTQSIRQPGSSFKPFIYSASLEKGLSPATIVNDAPVTYSAGQTGGQAWEPKNYDNKYAGPMSMRTGLTHSKNMVSIRILDKIGAQYGQEYITRFGFDAEKNPPYLTLALGAGAVTPLQMVTAYSVFANGGYKINPHLISKVTNTTGKVLSQVQPDKAGNESLRVIDERNAFMMDSMMKDVVRRGTAARAGQTLARPDLAGKTGTTNDSHDAWFVGYQYRIAGAAWIGYDQPRNLGSRETGGGLALPIWIGYMQKALKEIPVETRTAPKGLVQSGGEYHYVENPPGTGVRSIGVEEKPPESLDNFPWDSNGDAFDNDRGAKPNAEN